jgi:alkylhydroperoxidase/carboxymuconolactone decarboxylase family protein YurZ
VPAVECGHIQEEDQEVPVPDNTADTPVLDTLTDMIGASIDHNTLSPREFVLARLAALIAIEAPPASYLFQAKPAADLGITADDVQGVMIAVAPVVGAPRVVAASGNIMRALGFAIAVTEAEMSGNGDGA